jgi:predicted DNA-binding protein (UPF0278 family)
MKKKVYLSKRALVLRIRRKLLKQKETIAADFRGSYRRTDLAGNYVIEEDVNLLALAKELKCLRPWEEVRLTRSAYGSALGKE